MRERREERKLKRETEGKTTGYIEGKEEIQQKWKRRKWTGKEES